MYKAVVNSFHLDKKFILKKKKLPQTTEALMLAAVIKSEHWGPICFTTSLELWTLSVAVGEQINQEASGLL